MISQAKRRRLATGILVGAAIVFVLMQGWIAARLERTIYVTGWILMLLMIILTAYSPRKKLPFLPLKSSESWLRFHVYAGWISVFVFVLHISFRVPTGWFEGILAWLYILVALSGVAGLAISRIIPRRLTARGGEALFERIPMIRRQLKEKAESLAVESVAIGQASHIADFYVRELNPFFLGPRNFFMHLVESRRPVNRLLDKISDLKRYLNEAERKTLEQIASLVRQKDGLDYHHALQLALKLWLFVHIPLTYGLLFWSMVHVLVVYGFSGGAGQ